MTTTALPSTTVRNARDFFDALSTLGTLRVISVAGPSTFETICTVPHAGISDGYLNVISPEYHWHLDLSRFRHLASRDSVHERSRRRVLFFELREADYGTPFLFIYLHREKGAEFEPEQLMRFEALHRVLANGIALDVPEKSA